MKIRLHYRSLRNRPLWLYLWNSITLTQTDGLVVSGDTRHLLAAADMSALRYWWDQDCVTGNSKEGRERKTEERENRLSDRCTVELPVIKAIVQYEPSFSEHSYQFNIMSVSGWPCFQSLHSGLQGQKARMTLFQGEINQLWKLLVLFSSLIIHH